MTTESGRGAMRPNSRSCWGQFTAPTIDTAELPAPRAKSQSPCSGWPKGPYRVGVASSTGAFSTGTDSEFSGLGARTKSVGCPGGGTRLSTRSSLLPVLVTKSSEPATAEELVPVSRAGDGSPDCEQAAVAAPARSRTRRVFTRAYPRSSIDRC